MLIDTIGIKYATANDIFLLSKNFIKIDSKNK